MPSPLNLEHGKELSDGTCRFQSGGVNVFSILFFVVAAGGTGYGFYAGTGPGILAFGAIFAGVGALLTHARGLDIHPAKDRATAWKAILGIRYASTSVRARRPQLGAGGVAGAAGSNSKAVQDVELDGVVIMRRIDPERAKGIIREVERVALRKS